jgi:hypothetical protein
MGDERTCRYESASRTGEGRALLETSEIVFRGPFRARIAFDAMTNVRAEGGTLTFAHAGESVRLVFPGDAKRAQVWAKKIRTPKGRLAKLGIDAGTRVQVIGLATHDDATFFDELAAVGAIGSEDVATADAIVVMLRTAHDLERLRTLRASMRDDAAIWTLRAKGKGATVAEGEAMRAGHDAGLVDVKVAAFSETLSAMKWVVPKAERRA